MSRLHSRNVVGHGLKRIANKYASGLVIAKILEVGGLEEALENTSPEFIGNMYNDRKEADGQSSVGAYKSELKDAAFKERINYIIEKIAAVVMSKLENTVSNADTSLNDNELIGSLKNDDAVVSMLDNMFDVAVDNEFVENLLNGIKEKVKKAKELYKNKQKKEDEIKNQLKEEGTDSVDDDDDDDTKKDKDKNKDEKDDEGTESIRPRFRNKLYSKGKVSYTDESVVRIEQMTEAFMDKFENPTPEDINAFRSMVYLHESIELLNVIL